MWHHAPHPTTLLAMNRILLPAVLLAALLSGCVIDDSDSPGYYSRDPYYDGGRYGYRDEYGRYHDYRDEYDRGYRDGRHDRHDDDRDRRDRHHHNAPRPGEFTAGGSAKEFSFPAGQRHCRIEVVDGSVGFNTIVVRRGGAKQSIRISATYQRGQSFNVPIDGQATGLRISDTGRGRYRVIVK